MTSASTICCLIALPLNIFLYVPYGKEPCTPDLTVEGTLNTVYTVGDPLVVLTLSEVRNSDCSYALLLFDTSLGVAADPNIFALVQPVFDEDEVSSKKVTQRKPGSISVFTGALESKGSYRLVLEVFDDNGNEGKLFFTVEILSCKSVIES